MQRFKEENKALLIGLSFLISSIASASDSVVKYGGSVPKDGEPLAQTKALFVSHQNSLAGPLILQEEVGGWVDTRDGDYKSSALLGPSLGINVNAGYVYGQALIGPSFITHPDGVLGGPFQFNNDVAFGIKDPKTNATIGLNYKHVSSAGIETPNLGRDFLMFRVSLPW